MKTQNTTTGAGNTTAAHYRDGQTIPLSLGWSLYLCLNTGGEVTYLQGFVHGPKNRGSASLAAARELGETTDEWAIEIPAKVMRELQDEEFDQFD